MDKKHLQHTILEATYNREVWLNVLKYFFGVRKILQQPLQISIDNSKAEYAIELGSFVTADEREVGIFEVKLLPHVWIERNRVGLRNLLRQVYKYNVDAALIVFVQDNKWRFSYVSEIRTEEGKKETEPKRYTYLFGKGETCRTAADRFDKLKDKKFYLEDLYEAFSVEKLNNDFFKSYNEHYEKFWKYLAGEKKYYKLLADTRPKTEILKQKTIRDFAKKLLGRIVFLHFLQKKSWLGVPQNSREWKNGDVKFLQTLFANHKRKEKFHSTALKTLFFETLNTKRKNDIAPESLGEGIKIPYLNGGLFDKDISYENDIDFPAEYFKNLLDFFEQYNFTIDENDPYDTEIGIDPEMLGHIFENLLEENREKGAFYTPKEVVHYMCQESLIGYLHTQFPNEEKKDFELLVRNNQVSSAFSEYKKANEINEKLKTIKICDPAIGSGAFPMGLLKEIFECRRLLYGFLKTNEAFEPAAVKKEIIQQNIYGVDRENGAVEIARLRFWLALVVDEIKPQPLPNLDYKIMQGNSLLESFEGIDLSNVANDDIKIFEPEKDLFGNLKEHQLKLTYTQSHTVSEIQTLMKKFFSIEDAEEKLRIKNEVNEYVHKHIEWNIELRVMQFKRWIAELEASNHLNHKQEKKLEEYEQELERLKQSRVILHDYEQRNEKPFFLWKLFFADVFAKKGFDIVIANPPYLKERDNAHIFKDINESEFGKSWHQGKMDFWFYFLHKAIDISNPKAIITFITSRYWLNNQGAKKLIKRVAENLSFTNVVDIGKLRVFDNVAGHHMIAVYSKTKQLEFLYKKVQNDIRFISSFEESANLKLQTLNNSSVFSVSDEIIFSTETFDGSSEIQTLGDYYDVSQGVVEAPDKISTKQLKEKPSSKIKVGDGVFVLTEGEVEKLNLTKEEQAVLKPYLDPSDVARYVVHRGKKKYLIYADKEVKVLIATNKKYSNLKKHLDKFENFITSSNRPYGLHRPRNEEYFIQPKIVFKGMFVDPEFAYDIDENYLGFSFSSIIQKEEDFSLKYLLAVLNSKFSKNWFYSFGKMRGAGVDIGVEKLRTFPIKDTPHKNKFSVLIDYMLYLLNDENKHLISHTPNNRIAATIEEVLNMMVYELYFEDHMKENQLDVLAHLQPVEMKNISEDGNTIRDFYLWLQQPQNQIRNRIIAVNIKSPDVIARINAASY
jgi:adenine-specific DNA-methyltransferase